MTIKLKIRLMSLATLIQFILPRWFSVQVAKILGFLSYHILRNQRARIAKNLSHILPPPISKKTIVKYTRQTFINYAICLADLLRSPVLKKDQIISLVQVNLENFDRSVAEGNGVVLSSAHIGNWDFAGMFLSKLGYKLVAVTEPIPSGFTEAMNRYRGLGGMKLVSLTDKDQMNQSLERKSTLVLLADRDLTGKGFELPCFDAKRSFPKGPAAFALKYKAPLLLGYLILNPKPGRPYLGVIEPEIQYSETGDFKQDVYNLTQILSQRINKIIAQYPDQWFVFKADWR